MQNEEQKFVPKQKHDKVLDFSDLNVVIFKVYVAVEGSSGAGARDSDDLADMPALELIHTLFDGLMNNHVVDWDKHISVSPRTDKGKMRFFPPRFRLSLSKFQNLMIMLKVFPVRVNLILDEPPLSELNYNFHSLANDDTNEPTEPADPAELNVPTSIVHNVDLYATETEDVPETASKFVEEDKLVSKLWADKVQEEDETISE